MKKLPTFWKEIVLRKLLERQWRTDKKLEAQWIKPLSINLHNTTIYDVILLIQELVE